MLDNIISFIETQDEIFLPEKLYYTRTISNGSYVYAKAEVDPHTGIPKGEDAVVYYNESTGDPVEYIVTYLPETTSSVELENGDIRIIVSQKVVKLNVATGVVTQDTINTHTTNTTNNVIETETITRYSPANVLLGQIYRFEFLSDFAFLGYQPGLSDSADVGMYRVDQILSYREMLMQEISIYDNLYKPFDLPKSLFESDETRFDDKVTFYKLVDPNDEELVLYMPDIFISDHPDTNVDMFHKIMLGFTLGVFADVEQFSDLKQTIETLLETRYGIKTIADVFTFKQTYLTTQDYESIVEERAQTKNNSTLDLYDTLFLTEKGIKEKEILELRSKVIAYEELLTQIT